MKHERTAKIIGWTDAQDDELIALAGTMPSPELAEKIGRNFRQMQVRASKLGVSLAFRRTYTEWTRNQDDFLKDWCNKQLSHRRVKKILNIPGCFDKDPYEITHAELGAFLGKTVPSLRGRVGKLKREGLI